MHKISTIDEFDSLTLDLSRSFILGSGSNVAFVEDYDGDIIIFNDRTINVVEDRDCWFVEAGAGLSWHELVSFCVNRKMGGIENLALIPGSCGAAAVQNIGAYGVEFKDLCFAVETYDLKTGLQKRYENLQCCFEYRNSLFKQANYEHLLITKIVLQLQKSWCPIQKYNGLENISGELTPLTLMQRVIELRQSKLPDPKTLPNAGSFFKNPIVDGHLAHSLKKQCPEMPIYDAGNGKSKLSSGWLIEAAGLKGKQFNGIGTYDKHALVIVNNGSGNGESLLQFVREIKSRVLYLFSVALENEVLLIAKHGVIKL